MVRLLCTNLASQVWRRGEAGFRTPVSLMLPNDPACHGEHFPCVQGRQVPALCWAVTAACHSENGENVATKAALRFVMNSDLGEWKSGEAVALESHRC